MSNPIFNTMMQNTPMGKMVSQYQQFRNTFKGDPQQKIQEMLSTGQITQQQVDQARSMATQFKSMLNK